jgi:hypothetical protein
MRMQGMLIFHFVGVRVHAAVNDDTSRCRNADAIILASTTLGLRLSGDPVLCPEALSRGGDGRSAFVLGCIVGPVLPGKSCAVHYSCRSVS